MFLPMFIRVSGEAGPVVQSGTEWSNIRGCMFFLPRQPENHHAPGKDQPVPYEHVH